MNDNYDYNNSIIESALKIFEDGKKYQHSLWKEYLLRCANNLDFEGETANEVIKELVEIANEKFKDN